MSMKFPKLIAPVLDAEDGVALAEFWKSFLGLGYRPNQGPEDDPRFIVIDRSDGSPALAVQHVNKLVRADWPSGPNPQQAHLDLSVADRDDQQEQVARAVELGATVLDDRSDDDADPLVVLADPAGHPFCLIAPPAVADA